MELVYKNNTFDFWAFYEINKEEIEKIVWKASWKYQNIIDPEDMHTEILIRLYRSNFHNDFDSEKNSLNKYLVIKIYGYAGHIVKDFNRRIKIDCMEESKRYLFPSINGVNTDNIKEMIYEPSVDNDTEFNILKKEILEIIESSKLDKKQLKIFNYIYQGYSQIEIANLLNISPQSISINWQRIKKFITKKLEKALS